ncbi:Pyridoxal phosphate-dependent transferase [Phytophthora cactorum]|nr:Pyridoxal phosphate-dependent transferase [Phytophthora cactorum]
MAKVPRAVVNFLSDTVTRPSVAMRQVIAAAEVGDDVFAADPTRGVRHPNDELVRGADSVSLCLSKGLGAPVGSILAGSEEFIHHGKRLRKSLGGGMRQAGIIASAGLYALEHQFDRLVEDHVNAQAFAHGISSIPGVQIDPDIVDTNILQTKTKTKTMTTTRRVINFMSDTITCPTPRMRKAMAAAKVGDDVYGLDPTVKQLQKVVASMLGKEDAMFVPSLHVDGARLANASVSLGVALEDLVKGADTVSFCLSKGLGAPIGSVLAGSEEFIHHAKRLRKSLGGGLRQSGVVAAGALYALEHQFDRLAEDHENAKTLAYGLSTIPGIQIDVDSVDTNMLFFKVSSDFKIDTPTLVKKVEEEKGIVFGGYWRDEEIRAVINLHVTPDDVEYTIAAVRDILAASESNFQVA